MSPDAYLEMAETENTHWWFVSRRKILSRLLEGLGLPENARILEVGSGTGGNLEMLSRFGTVHAIEMDDTAREIARSRTGGDVAIERGVCPDEIPYHGQQFDLICLFDVLEHIDRDEETLKALSSMLAPGGQMLLTVPAYRWMWSAHDEYLHHHRRYSAREFRDKTAAAGLKLTRFSHFNAFLLPLAVAARLKDRIAGSGQSTGGAIPSGPLNALFRAVFGSEAAVLSRTNLPVGLSMFGILRRA